MLANLIRVWIIGFNGTAAPVSVLLLLLVGQRRSLPPFRSEYPKKENSRATAATHVPRPLHERQRQAKPSEKEIKRRLSTGTNNLCEPGAHFSAEQWTVAQIAGRLVAGELGGQCSPASLRDTGAELLANPTQSLAGNVPGVLLPVP